MVDRLTMDQEVEEQSTMDPGGEELLSMDLEVVEKSTTDPEEEGI